MKDSGRTGIIGVLLNEYKNALMDLLHHIEDVNEEQLSTIVDSETKNKDCVSIQSILTHIVFCGENYLTMIDLDRGKTDSAWPKRRPYNTVQEYQQDIHQLYEQTMACFEEITDSETQQMDPRKKIKTSWGQLYDYEQLMEHAIVHVYRHRYQIEKFKVKLGEKT